jgi:hypothetical protein
MFTYAKFIYVAPVPAYQAIADQDLDFAIPAKADPYLAFHLNVVPVRIQLEN